LVKDSYILNESIKNKIAKPSISIEARKLNEQLHVHVLHLLKNEIFKRNLVVKKISLLGLAFKGTPSTDDIRDSFSIKFYKKLLLNFKKSKIVAFDPLVKHEDFLKYQIKRITNIKKIFFKSDLVIILNNNLIFKKLNLNNLSKLMNNSAIIYDFWNLFDNKKIKLSNDTKYIGFGNLVR
jgi:UDP-N-acetyl-D-mannosaminuronic acid dehydrogenase